MARLLEETERYDTLHGGHPSRHGKSGLGACHGDRDRGGGQGLCGQLLGRVRSISRAAASAAALSQVDDGPGLSEPGVQTKRPSLPHVLGLAMLGHPCLLHLWVLDLSVPSPGISPAQPPTPPSKAPSFVKVLIKCTLFSFLKSVTPFVFYSVTIIIYITTYMHLKV